MGNKIITEKDFWVCSEGNMPAPFQGTRLGTKKKSGDIYITVEDKATSSCIDFGCKKFMLLMAIAAAVLVVGAILLGVLTVATGGAALIAIGALAGLAGAAIGAVVGGMLCGHKMATKRVWTGSKKNFISQGVATITGGHKMTCPIGGVITFAPEIKNWSQAFAMGAANYIGGLMEGMMAGALVGMGGAAFSGGAAAMSGGAGLRGLGQAAWQFAKSMPKNFIVNVAESFSKFGLALRGVMGVQNTAATYGNTGQATLQDFFKGTVAMETGAMESVQNIFSGKGTWQDVAGMVLMFSPVGRGKQDLENSMSSKPDDAETGKPEEEGTAKPDAQNTEGPPKHEGESNAYTSSLDGDPPGTYRDNNGRLHDSDTHLFVAEPNRVTPNDSPLIQSDSERPSWRQSELDAEEMYPGYDTQKSFIDGEEVPYGTEHSTRPDLYTNGHSVEVKNYNVETASGRSNLISELTRQYTDRINNLPEGTNQTAIIDVRGQNVTPEALIQLESRIIENCPNLEVIFLS